jgi:hypothetical protein
MNTLLIFAVVQAFKLVVLARFNRVALFRILALRQQLSLYKRKAKKPRLRTSDRLFWPLLSKIWRDWSLELILVRPETVIRWRRRKFREFWRKKSRRGSGRPAIPYGAIESKGHPLQRDRASKPRVEWTKQQVRNACFDEQPKFLIHDNDGKFGQLGRPLGAETAGKRISCRTTFDVWLWQVMGIRGIPIRTVHPTQRHRSSV